MSNEKEAAYEDMDIVKDLNPEIPEGEENPLEDDEEFDDDFDEDDDDDDDDFDEDDDEE